MLELTNSNLPFGRQKWNPVFGKTICSQENGNPILLTFSQCYPGKFSCDSGHCIPLEERCNIELNCEDKKDEHNCAGIKIGNDYARGKMPVSVPAKPTIIYINVSILAFPSISTKNVKFSADFYLNLRWHDIRLDMWDLNEDFSKNSLSKEQLDALWKPKLGFVNTITKLYSIQPLHGTLIRESDPLSEDITFSTEGNNNLSICIHIFYISFYSEAYIYPGKENSIYVTQRYIQEFLCQFKLEYYPFDTQVCIYKINFTLL